jgi:hypothetical protein
MLQEVSKWPSLSTPPAKEQAAIRYRSRTVYTTYRKALFAKPTRRRYALTYTLLLSMFGGESSGGHALGGSLVPLPAALVGAGQPEARAARLSRNTAMSGGLQPVARGSASEWIADWLVATGFWLCLQDFRIGVLLHPRSRLD